MAGGKRWEQERKGLGGEAAGPAPAGSKEDGLGISFRAEQGAAELSGTQNLTHV